MRVLVVSAAHARDHGATRQTGQHGASAVEFALVAPVLFLVLFAIIAFGIVFAQSLAMENGARTGARAGVVGGATCADIEAAFQGDADTLALDGADASVVVGTTPGANDLCNGANSTTIPCQGLDPGASIHVTGSETTTMLGIIPFADLGSQVLEGTATYECEFQ